MAVTVKTEGSQTAVISTEHTLATITDSGAYVLCVDLANLALGDTVELRVKTKLTSGDTLQLAYEASYFNNQAVLNVYAPPVASPIEYVATLKQIGGTGRAFIWAIYQL